MLTRFVQKIRHRTLCLLIGQAPIVANMVVSGGVELRGDAGGWVHQCEFYPGDGIALGSKNSPFAISQREESAKVYQS